MTNVSELASHLANAERRTSRGGVSCFCDIEAKHRTRLVLELTYPEINVNEIPEHDWKTFYEDVEEVMPLNALEKRGKRIDLRLNIGSCGRLRDTSCEDEFYYRNE